MIYMRKQYTTRWSWIIFYHISFQNLPLYHYKVIIFTLHMKVRIFLKIVYQCNLFICWCFFIWGSTSLLTHGIDRIMTGSCLSEEIVRSTFFKFLHCKRCAVESPTNWLATTNSQTPTRQWKNKKKCRYFTRSS